MKRTRLKLEDGTVVQPVIEGRLREALASLDPSNTFAILERDDGAFMQTSGSLNDGFYLEYRLKQTEAHYAAAAEALPAEKIEEVMLRFARYEAGWRNALDWRVVAEATTQPPPSNWPLAAAWFLFAVAVVLTAWAYSVEDKTQTLPYFVVFLCFVFLWVLIDTARAKEWWRLASLTLMLSGTGAMFADAVPAGATLFGLGLGTEIVGALKSGKISVRGQTFDQEKHSITFGCLLFIYAAGAVLMTGLGLWKLLFP